MVVDRPDGVKRDNDDDSSKPKKSQRKGGDLSFTNKEEAPLALTDAEQSKAIPKSLVASKPPQTIRKRIVKKSEYQSFTKKENYGLL